MKSKNMTKTSSALGVSTTQRPHRFTTALILGLAAATLGACKHDEYRGEVAGWTLMEPAQRHPILVSKEPETLDISVARNSQGLSPHQRADLIHFAQRARASDAGNSKLIIVAPTGGQNEISSMYAVQEIRGLLADIGFPESSISIEASYDETGPIQVSYLRYIAEGPTCGDWSTNLGVHPQRLAYPNFGCSSQRNLAAMVANPADLLGPRTESERFADRRRAVMDKYVAGDSTGAEKSGDERVGTEK
jgi:pilus assembly protein CpaD